MTNYGPGLPQKNAPKKPSMIDLNSWCLEHGRLPLWEDGDMNNGKNFRRRRYDSALKGWRAEAELAQLAAAQLLDDTDADAA
jgi:hypothetical protein